MDLETRVSGHEKPQRRNPEDPDCQYAKTRSSPCKPLGRFEEVASRTSAGSWTHQNGFGDTSLFEIYSNQAITGPYQQMGFRGEKRGYGNNKEVQERSCCHVENNQC
uniref:uORF protein n=1 Tax=Zika virus TaxID=64320 RepID=UORF_ZIKV